MTSGTQQQRKSSSSNSNTAITTTRVVIMKTFRLVPLILAGFCGYLHTVINRRFDEMGDLMGSGGSTVGNMIDAPRMALVNGAMGGSTAGGVGGGSKNVNTNNNQQQQLQRQQQRQAQLMPSQRVNIGTLVGPAVDLMEKSQSFEWKPPKSDARIIANSDDYDQMLLHYTMNLLPNHRDPSASKGNALEKKADPDDSYEEDVNNPKPYKFKQIDMIVPASGQDDRLRVFAERLGIALKNYNQWYETERKPALLRKIKQEEQEEEGIGAADDAGDKTGAEANNKDNAYDFELKFRLLITRYPEDAQKTEKDFDALIMDLSEKTTLPREQIVLVLVGDQQQQQQKQEGDSSTSEQPKYPLRFNRAHARNVLHQNACHSDTCIVTSFDVDMQVLPIFFHRALLSVTPHVKAYFPIVFSEFNPETVQIVQDFLLRPSPSNNQNNNNNNNNGGGSGDHQSEGGVLPETANDEEQDPMLEPFSRHRGLWRDFGYGMYVMAGSDAKRFRFNEEHQGWGHEDTDFYKLVHNNMRVDRQREHGLIHAWHTKNCAPGKDIMTNAQWLDCLKSRDIMEGSALGLLLRPAQRTYKLEDFPGLPGKKTTPPASSSATTTTQVRSKSKSKSQAQESTTKVETEAEAGKTSKEDSTAEADGKDKNDDGKEDDEPEEEEKDEGKEVVETEQEKSDSGEKQDEVATTNLRGNLVEEERQK